MSHLAITVTVSGKIESVCERVAEAIKPIGFGILTRIDFDKKIKEKIGETIQPCIILGACNPTLAFSAYKQSSDTAMLIPCNIILTEVAPDKIRIEAMKPTQMLRLLPEIGMESEIAKFESGLRTVLEHLIT